MSSEMTMVLNLALTGLAIYALVRLAKRRSKNRPKRHSEMDVMNDKLTNMSNELKELDERLMKERNERN
ncbi:MAG: hypothetical protein ACM3NT_09505 [Methylocystaceae bacterium]